MGSLKLGRVSSLARSQSQYLVESGLDLRSRLGSETGTIHNFLRLPEVLEVGCRCGEGLYIIKTLSPGGCVTPGPPPPPPPTRFPRFAQPGGHGDTGRKRLVNALPVHSTIAGLSHIGE